jgi:hypothetical protein
LAIRSHSTPSSLSMHRPSPEPYSTPNSILYTPSPAAVRSRILRCAAIPSRPSVIDAQRARFPKPGRVHSSRYIVGVAAACNHCNESKLCMTTSFPPFITWHPGNSPPGSLSQPEQCCRLGNACALHVYAVAAYLWGAESGRVRDDVRADCYKTGISTLSPLPPALPHPKLVHYPNLSQTQPNQPCVSPLERRVDESADVAGSLCSEYGQLPPDPSQRLILTSWPLRSR